MFLFLVMIGFSAVVVEMREATGKKAVRVGLHKDVQPLLPELGGVLEENDCKNSCCDLEKGSCDILTLARSFSHELSWR